MPLDMFLYFGIKLDPTGLITGLQSMGESTNGEKYSPPPIHVQRMVNRMFEHGEGEIPLA
jgi:hypothetical protein